MILRYNPSLKSIARKLRDTMTDAEQALWTKIRNRQINDKQFYRQRPIGNYIVDFYCPTSNLVIEVDGGQHYEKNAMESDAERDDYIKSLGLNVLRFSNRDVLQEMDSVLRKIHEETNPSQPPFSKGRRVE